MGIPTLSERRWVTLKDIQDGQNKAAYQVIKQLWADFNKIIDDNTEFNSIESVILYLAHDQEQAKKDLEKLKLECKL